jgi:transposase
MEHFAGLDVSVKDTSVCIVDDTGKIVREVRVASEPEALSAVLKSPAYHFKRIGLEAGLNSWSISAAQHAPKRSGNCSIGRSHALRLYRLRFSL